MKRQNKIIIIMLSVLTIILLSLVILLATDIINFRSNNTSKENKIIISQKSSVPLSKILEYYKQRVTDLNDGKHEYSVIDINNDNIPELFVYIGGTIENEIIANTSIVTYDENKGDKDNNYIVNIGNLNARIDVNTIFYKMNDGTLLQVFEHK